MNAPPLSDLRVLDLSHQYAGGLAACLLADLGAQVVVVEHPRGSPMRTMLPQKDGESLWWKVVGRGKRGITLDLSTPRGRELSLRLASQFDVLIENFRPGTMERWGLGPDDLATVCDRLVMLRISGFGQNGPLRERPGFGTVAEAMSGFAHLNGRPMDPPVFPSTTLADGVAGTFGALGVLAALTASPGRDARGVQVVDMALFEGLFRLIPTQLPTFDQLGIAPKRPGNFLGSHGVLRNLYETADGVYFVVSAIGQAPISRIIEAAEATDLVERLPDVLQNGDPDVFEAFLGQADDVVTAWAHGNQWADVSAALTETGAAFQRVYDAQDITNDPHFQARGDLLRVADAKLGSILMAGVVPKFPGRRLDVRSAGPELGEHNDQIYSELLGLTASDLSELREAAVI